MARARGGQFVGQPRERLGRVLVGAGEDVDVGIRRHRRGRLVRIGEERHRLAQAAQDDVARAGQRLDRDIDHVGDAIHRHPAAAARDARVGALGDQLRAGGGGDAVGILQRLGAHRLAAEHDQASAGRGAGFRRPCSPGPGRSAAAAAPAAARRPRRPRPRRCRRAGSAWRSARDGCARPAPPRRHRRRRWPTRRRCAPRRKRRAPSPRYRRSAARRSGGGRSPGRRRC